MSPLAGHAVIPAGWASHHRPTVATTLTATVAITRRDADAVNDARAWSAKGPRAAAAPEVVVLASCPARVQALLSQVRDAEVAGADVAWRLYLVQVPADVPALRAGRGEGDRIVVLTAPGDPGLVGRRLLIRDIAYGSQVFTRDLVCSDDLAANNPPATTPPATTPPAGAPA